jgi:hypothetical protein
MSNLLNSLKSDLLDRRLLPFLLLLGAVLAAAVAYAVLSGSSGTTAAPSAAATPAGRSTSGPGSTLAVSQAAADPHAAVAETTEGSHYQHHSGAHDPFKPLVSAKAPGAKSASTGSSSTTGSSTSGSTPTTSSGSATGGGGTTPTTPTEPAPTKPAKPVHVYIVDVLFGLAPTTPGQLSQLTPYADLKRLEPLPSASDPRILFAGVSDTGKGAVFALAGEAILKGEGACLPSATQCEAIDLAVGKTEELEYLEASGQTVAYELKIVSISEHQASAATAARLSRRDRKGQALLRHLSAPVLHHLRFSSAKGVLVYVAHHGA